MNQSAEQRILHDKCISYIEISNCALNREREGDEINMPNWPYMIDGTDLISKLNCTQIGANES